MPNQDTYGDISAALGDLLFGRREGLGSREITVDSLVALVLAQVSAAQSRTYLGTVANQTAMLALPGNQGDWCIRSDTTSVWELIDAAAPTVLASWKEYPSSGGGGSYAWGTWQSPALQNGWANLGGYQGARYVLEDSKLLRIEGTITGGTPFAGTTLFTLPSGHRPAANQIFACRSGGGSPEKAISIYVNSDGTVNIDGTQAAQSWITLSGIAFRID